ncbi:hypothetical protein [Desulfofalx alkaliphila]|uniref:hypothetical protein n=1 Tax=Desulfofalx alkaliphila TaxID=105483 RepID=UPI0004E0CB29|nr:hypothetical protein [Desulfofalx alkaliphila]
MKKVVSVSLGSSKRNHTATVELMGEKFELSRVGTDGDFKKAVQILQRLDGNVDAIGLGGIDIYLFAGKRRYAIPDGLKLMQTVKKTPVVDGSGLKNTLERETTNYLIKEGHLKPGTKVLMVSAVDRFGMAEALVENGCQTTFGDLIFSIGIPCAIGSLKKLERVANLLLPLVIKLPFDFLYPTGKKQDEKTKGVSKYAKYYHRAEVIAGDFHFIKKYLPPKLSGQMIITNTTTKEDLDLLAERGASMLVTTTPEFNGRSFGTNVVEAMLVAMLGKKWEDITPEEYTQLLRKLDFKPRIVKF